MDFGLKDFRWCRSERGHATKRRGKELLLIEQWAGRLPCSPLAEANDIFRQFAALEAGEPSLPAPEFSIDELPTRPRSFVDFANRYGLLTDIANPDDPHSEPVSLWLEEVGAMRHAVLVWDAIKNGDSTRLAQYFAWEDMGKEEYRATYTDDREISCLLDVKRPPRSPDDLSAPASVWLATTISKHTEAFSPQVSYLEDIKSFELVWKPPDLRTALWLRFLKAVLDDNEWRPCEECGRWLEIGRGTARISRQFCSNACKVRSYRRRKCSAVSLHKKGKTLRTIARELGSDVETVRGWIKGTNVE